ncbi:MAG: hypothetical protein IGS03_16995 [Candidatus Sericytochromatia bacterium]|nr:hypothetical protein [Candidatus Sericytochromatia bacterium]
MTLPQRPFYQAWLCLWLAVLCCGGGCSATARDALRAGSGSFVFSPSRTTTQLQVWYYHPPNLRPEDPIVFVMHGVKRNGQKYRDSWVKHAQNKRFLLLVPEFSQQAYPGSAGYNLGNMFAASGRPNAPDLWGFTVIEQLFDHVRELTQSQASAYSLYGHSAGAQFVHRLLMFQPDARVKTAIAANAGWYTMPTDRVAFPYGLKHSGTNLATVSQAFTHDLVILLGEKDTDTRDNNLRTTPEAMAQGPHRLARGHAFYNAAQQAAQSQNVRLNWQLKEVAGVGHSNTKMAEAAAGILR